MDDFPARTSGADYPNPLEPGAYSRSEYSDDFAGA